MVALAFSVVTVSAQVNRLDDLDRFGEDAVAVSFGQASTNSLAGAGSEVGQLLGRWGVHFQAAEGNGLQISTFTVAVTGPPAFFYEIAHKPLAQEEDGPISVSLVRPAALESPPDYSVSSFTMKLLLLLAALLPAQYLADLPIATLGFDAGELKESFNESGNQTRMIIVFSPT